MRKLPVFLFLTLLTFLGIGQENALGYFEDALRFSQTNYSLGSSARMQAIGGASVSLGGDISSAVSNPAGLGFFNKSVFTLSPSLNFSSVDTRFSVQEGATQGSEDTFNSNFNMANIGTVINWNKGRFTNDKFKGGSLAISLNRANNFRLERAYEGENDFNSLVDAIALNAGNGVPNSLDELSFAAYDQFLISPETDDNGNILGYFADFDGFPIQQETIREEGSHYQMNIAWGGNYDDRFYFGGGMGLQFLNYRQRRVYNESEFVVFDNEGNVVGADPRLDAFTLVDDLDLRGTGINFNLGAIFRPFSFMTLGISYTSPSFLSLDEESFLDLNANWFDNVTGPEGENLSEIDPYESPLFVTEYTLRTPMRLRLGTSLFIGKSGFLTGDIEWVDYANATIHSDDFSASGDNQAIAQLYRSVMNVRVGGEYRIQSFRLRAGYSLFPSPYSDANLNEVTNITFGVGYRTADYFLDLAVVTTEQSISYAPYFINDGFQPIADSDIHHTAATITFGVNF